MVQLGTAADDIGYLVLRKLRTGRNRRLPTTASEPSTISTPRPSDA
jgi:hypothetical protein